MGRQVQAPFVLLNSGTKMPIIGLGTACVPAPANHVIENAVLAAIESGYRHIDTASFYRSEGAVGEALKKAFERGIVNRDDVFVTTKLWCADNHPDYVLPALRKSLRELQLDYVDLYLIHWPVRLKEGVETLDVHPEDNLPVDIESTWQVMEKLVELGLARAIGVSNFSCKKMRDLLGYAKIRPAVNQVEMHPHWQQRNLREFCKRENVHVTAWSPLGGVGTPWGSNHVIQSCVLREIAEKHGKTPAQAALRWAIEQGVIVIPKTYDNGRILENISIFDWCLDANDLEKINGLEQIKIYDAKIFLNPINGPYKILDDFWDGEI